MGQDCKKAVEACLAWYEMYVKLWHPVIVTVEMHVHSLSQVISVSLCDGELIGLLTGTSSGHCRPPEDQKQAGACKHCKACIYLLKQNGSLSSNSLC